jgi:ribosomal protein S18 acetylase RimI-like enzyme
MYFEQKVHRHLDWRTPLDWLGVPEYWVLEQDGVVTAALACPPDPETVSWIRLFVAASTLPLPEAWTSLWATAREVLSGRGITAASIVVHDWLQELLAGSGFVERQQIVVLEQNAAPFETMPNTAGVFIRPMAYEDLLVVASIDSAAFGRLWQNSLESLRFAFSQAGFSTVAQLGNEVVAYQISTRNPFGAHLARLAVLPGLQGRNIGYLIVQDLLQQLRRTGLFRLTVNTQNDNLASLALYEKIGFKRTGECYSVFACEI